MSAQSAPIHEGENVVDRNDGPGRRLRETRQARGLAISRIASELHLNPSAITSLENDRYDELPGPVFVAGYMRNYARLLNMDPEPLLDALRAANPEAEPTTRPRAPRRPKEQVSSGHLAVRIVSLAIFAVIAGLAFVWWQNQRPSEPLVEEATEEVVTTTAQDETEAMQAQPEQISIAPPSPQPESLPAIESSPTTESIPAPEQPPADTLLTEESEEPTAPIAEEQRPPAQPVASEEDPTAGDAAPGGEIIIEFSGPCWVDIRDSERNYKLFGEMSKGDRQVLDGKPPYSIIIGNASAVQITVAGKPFDLNAIARGNVARFTLDPTQLP